MNLELTSIDVTRTLAPGSVAIVLGTRPEIVKLAPIIRCLGAAAYIVHTGQHYDESMTDVFFRGHGLPAPDLQLRTGGLSRAGQIAGALRGLDDLFQQRRFSAVMVQGDTNATVAGALAANAHGIPLVHVEAGLRGHDRAMPEEHNRIVTDHLSDLLCAATAGNVANLRSEGIPADRIVMTGNTVVEAVLTQLPPLAERLRLLERLDVRAERYLLATIHRPENTDDPENLGSILRELVGCGIPVILPIHPRTRAAVTAAGLASLLRPLTVIDPVDSATFLALAAHCALLVSDSGGVQEECTVLKRPLVVVRRSTERPEAMNDFATLVSPGQELGVAIRNALQELETRLPALAATPSPFGDENAARLIVRATSRMLFDRAGVAPSVHEPARPSRHQRVHSTPQLSVQEVR